MGLLRSFDSQTRPSRRLSLAPKSAKGSSAKQYWYFRPAVISAERPRSNVCFLASSEYLAEDGGQQDKVGMIAGKGARASRAPERQSPSCPNIRTLG